MGQFGFVLRKTQTGKSNDNQVYIILKISGFKAFKSSMLSDSSALESIFKKLCFPDGLMWMVGQTVEMKLSFKFRHNGDAASSE